jgi:ATP-dependent DNA ligase
MPWTLPDPMLTTAVDSPALPAGATAEPKWDGFRAQLAVHEDGRVLLRSRQGTDMTDAFVESGHSPHQTADLLDRLATTRIFTTWQHNRDTDEVLWRLPHQKASSHPEPPRVR